MSEVIRWLESPDGENWSRSRHPNRKIPLVSVKEDDSDWATEIFLWVA